MATPVPWELTHDTVYKRLPPLGTLSRSSSSTSLYYDADLYTPSFGTYVDDDSNSEYATPRETTPVSSEIDLTKLQQQAITTDSYRHKKDTIKLERRKATSTTPSSTTTPARNIHFILQLLTKMERQFKHLIYRIANKIFQHRGTLYWIIACIIMRNRIMQVIQGILVLVGQLFAKRLGFPNPHSSGIRVLLSIFTGRHGQLTL
ncbi:hypothetical protein K492DRAFT_6310 [Lichtheimia hyalospora FSU 10163]|nr:hypothetical protein K492DRAFT_6310 [Lichtheimia hyalospora FSU 10163]